ncbi:dihydrofolate reductase family protein [Aquipuribacter sp. MA13-6]|uniref:dihydrofolate reductase family protein n=1 Tax=unclassified Aquipuribacter TaxID=2635084 RepID=UPI003EED920B
MRALVYFVAVSLDGRIVGPGGETDAFPVDPDYLARLAQEWGDGLPTAFHQAMGTEPPRTRWDTVVMGRGTFQPALDAGVADPYAHLDTYVFSRTLDPDEHPEVTVVAEDAAGFVRALKQRDGGDIWLCGGGALAGALAEEVDRLVLKVNPVVLGDGIPLFAGPSAPTAWRPAEQEAPGAGVLVLTYERVRT